MKHLHFVRGVNAATCVARVEVYALSLFFVALLLAGGVAMDSAGNVYVAYSPALRSDPEYLVKAREKGANRPVRITKLLTILIGLSESVPALLER